MDKQFHILGNKVDCFQDYRELYDYILSELNNSKAKYITVNNVHTMVEGFRRNDYQEIINNSYLSIPDGKPLSIIGKLRGRKGVSRLFGPTIMEKFIDWGRKDNISHFFFGGSEENLEKLRVQIQKKYPGTHIVGMVSPPYRSVTEWDNSRFIREINEAKPDFIWIGLGAPKQERWMYSHYKDINGLLFGIGAGFDYLAGNTKHAPIWMKNLSLEWLYRLIQEPKRLWKRYFTTIPPFIFFAGMELLGFRIKRK